MCGLTPSNSFYGDNEDDNADEHHKYPYIYGELNLCKVCSRALHVLIHLIFITTSFGRNFYYSHFSCKDTEAQRSNITGDVG